MDAPGVRRPSFASSRKRSGPRRSETSDDAAFDSPSIRSGEIRRSPSDAPIFVGLQRARLNLVLTDLIPMNWDRARGLAGLTTVWQGYHVCVIALEYAHPNRIPFCGGEHVRARTAARDPAGHLRKPAGRTRRGGARNANRRVRHPPVAVSRRRGRSRVGPRLYRSASLRSSGYGSSSAVRTAPAICVSTAETFTGCRVSFAIHTVVLSEPPSAEVISTL